jgi:hypothetical protein
MVLEGIKERMEETIGPRKRGREMKKRRREEVKKKKKQIRVDKLGCPGEGAMVVPAYLGVPRTSALATYGYSIHL